MNSVATVIAAIAACLIAVVLIVVMVVVATANQETAISATLIQKEVENRKANDKMWDVIDQVIQTSSAQKNKLNEMLIAFSKASDEDARQQQTLTTWINNTSPNLEEDTFKSFHKIITSQRASFAVRQSELRELKSKHDKLFKVFPSNYILNFLDREPIKTTIETTKTEVSSKTNG